MGRAEPGLFSPGSAAESLDSETLRYGLRSHAAHQDSAQNDNQRDRESKSKIPNP